ncbi:MAG: DUF4301 family protein [Maribacter sp.]|nr:DUF4301 family protein [Maribacter sp.]
MKFTEKDLLQLSQKGISTEIIYQQIETFTSGIPYVSLEKAAVIGDGILKISAAEEKQLIKRFESLRKGLSLIKFVPASGAASRMFKSLFNFLEAYSPRTETLEDFLSRTNDTDIALFSKHLTEFPFFEILKNRIKGNAASRDQEVYFCVQEMLGEDKLNFGFFPKGLLPFHNYGKKLVTPFEEHLKEGAIYSKVNDTAHLHFTISEQHRELFKEKLVNIKEQVSKTTNTVFNVRFSIQKSSTDTIAVDLNNRPFRDSDGCLVFRPGGHGALIENLNELDADIIFIKNIDNVVVNKHLSEVTDSKKILAGKLLKVQQKVFEYAKMLESRPISEGSINQIRAFLERDMNVRFLDNFDGLDQPSQIKILKNKINRPIRVCGMVKNEGEPGGGPFWIRDSHGNISLQIVESAQVDIENEKQVQLLRNSTHFNPVDLVCGVKDHKGIKFDLLEFVDKKQGFITKKTKDGKALKALELPGLWNGAMAFWNTIFIEVPLITFNPVKTVTDLLKPSHRPG